MKFIIRIAGLAALALAQAVFPASAADPVPETPIPVPELAIPVPFAFFDWTGVYVGAQVGAGKGRVSHVVPGLDGTAYSEPEGTVAGIYGGYNRHLSNDVVIGIDADVAWTGLADDGPDGFTLCYCGQPVDISTETRWSSAVRGRVGYAFGRWLPYVAIGIAATETRGIYDYSSSDVTVYSDTRLGWTLGAGLEYAFRDNMVFRTEYRRSDFGKRDEPGFLMSSDEAKPGRYTANEFRLGVAFAF